MRLEEVTVEPHVGQLRPLLHRHGGLVQIIDTSTLHGEQEGRVGRNDELTAIESGTVGQESVRLVFPERKAPMALIFSA